ncbi:rna-directed dna polymerase from mobile element jockey-like [Limosa lapponica baueri]|uniref:Rna-directed dna polymerase from mobile element jockey-like n=1 Tax=Limosa lapponica baueri TaxID=1758121 RepID=A0A2I0URM0_LIMLA|nr:rna-directed dna polymerase from mobile element jockey-like [Limosa lapponica baueri]
MATKRPKAPVKKNVGTQTELPRKDAAVQGPGCTECLSLAVAPQGPRDTHCVRCEQINGLLRQVVELREEVERLRSIRECESEIDWWSRTLRQRQQEEALIKVDDPLPPCHQAERGDLIERGEWKLVLPQRGRQNPQQPPSPSQLHLYNRFGVLDFGDETSLWRFTFVNIKATWLNVILKVSVLFSTENTWDFNHDSFFFSESMLRLTLWKAGRFFKEEVLKAQEQAVPVGSKVSCPGKRPAWLNKEIRSQLREKRRVYGLWKKGQATQEDYKGVVKLCREKIRKAKAQLELALDVKNNKKNFYKYINSKRRTRESLHPLLDMGSNIVTKDEEKAEVLNAFFASVFSSGVGCPPSTQTPELAVRGGEQNEAPIIQREVVRDLLQYLDTNKSMGPDGIHPRVLRELVEVLAETLSIIYQQPWQTGGVPADWRLANVTPIHKKGRKDDPGNYRPVSLTSLPGKVMEQIILSAIMQCLKDTQVIRPSQHGFMRVRSCLTNLISFCDKVTRLVDEGKAVDVVYLDFSKAFDTVSHSILLEKLAAHGLDGNTLCWEGKNGRKQEKRGEAEEGKALGNQACALAAVREGEE